MQTGADKSDLINKCVAFQKKRSLGLLLSRRPGHLFWRLLGGIHWGVLLFGWFLSGGWGVSVGLSLWRLEAYERLYGLSLSVWIVGGGLVFCVFS